MAFRHLMKTALRGALQQAPAAVARRPAVLASLSAAAPASLRPATAMWVRSFGAQVRRSMHAGVGFWFDRVV